MTKEIKKRIQKFILGQKDRMTQIFNEKGEVIPVTVINVSPNIITAVKDIEKDGYKAVQVATVEQKEQRVNKAQKGQFGGKGYKFVKEFRVEDISSYNPGDEISLDIFEEGEVIETTSISKGKGFQGGVKR